MSASVHPYLLRTRAQGPRAIRVALMAFLSGLLLYLDRPGLVGPLPVPLFTALLYAGLVAPAAVLTAVLLPGLAALTDAVQVSRLGFAAAVAAFPAWLRPLADQPVLSASIVVLGGSALLWLWRRRGGLRGGGLPA